MSSTALANSVIDIPGWYIEFQAAVLRQLPRPGEINMETAQFWSTRQKWLKSNQHRALVARPKLAYEQLQQKLQAILHNAALGFSITRGETHEITRAYRKITYDQISELIKARHNLMTSRVLTAQERGLMDIIDAAFADYDRALGLVD